MILFPFENIWPDNYLEYIGGKTTEYVVANELRIRS